MKHKKDLVWNYISMLIMAASGLIMDAIIALFYDSDALGIFNETYAWYTILSQVSTFGIHMAILKMVPEQTDEKKRKTILNAAFFSVIVISIAVILLANVVLIPIDGLILKPSLQKALLGLLFFSINKVLLNYLNARFKFISFALFQSIRYCLMVLFLFWMAKTNVDRNSLAYVFLLSESILFLSLLLYLLLTKETCFKLNASEVREVIMFGARITPANMVVEMNTKVDVVCLGFFISDHSIIGVYSFAILFAEGFYTIFTTIRKIINPGISETNAKGGLKEYIDKCTGIINKYKVVGTVAVLALVMAVYYASCLLLGREEYIIGLIYIAVICAAIALTQKAIIWGDILSQCGFPLDESKANGISITVNIVFNTVLIMLFGPIGASVATAVSHFAYAIAQRILIRRRIGIVL